MKTGLISIRFPKEDIAIIEEKAKEERTDKTTAFKKMLAIGIKQYKLEKAIKQYQEGKISIGKAAKTADISLWEMIEELKERNIANPLTKEEYKQGLQNLEKIWKK